MKKRKMKKENKKKKNKQTNKGNMFSNDKKGV